MHQHSIVVNRGVCLLSFHALWHVAVPCPGRSFGRSDDGTIPAGATSHDHHGEGRVVGHPQIDVDGLCIFGGRDYVDRCRGRMAERHLTGGGVR